MSSEEELDGIERTVETTMYRYLFLRALRLLAVALMLLSVELAVLVLAVIGLAYLRGWMLAAGLGLLAAVIGIRVWCWRVNARRRPAEPSRAWGVVVKLASLPLNVLVVPAFAAWMPDRVAGVAVVVLTAVELLLWLVIRSPRAEGLRTAMRFTQDTTPPRTWEV